MGHSIMSGPIPASVPWWLTDAAVDLDFVNGRYYDGLDGAAVTNLLSISRASVGTAQNSGGSWVTFASNELRITNLGLLVELSRTNNLLNSGAPVTQTTASLGTGDYTLWVEGSGSALASAGSATITGAASATAGSPDTFTVTGAGTVTVTVTGSLTRFQLEEGAFATSYIPTTGATVTRAADLVQGIGTLSTVPVAATGSAYADVKMISPSTGAFTRFLGATSDHELIGESSDTTAITFRGGGGGILSAGAAAGGRLFTTGMKTAVGWDGSGRSVVGGGSTVGTDAQTANPNALVIGSANGTGGFSNTYFRRIAFWTARLADATLQGLTP